MMPAEQHAYAATTTPPPAVVDYDPIPRVSLPTPAEFRQRYVIPRRPVIITGLCDRWPAAQRWSLAHLAEASAGARIVSLGLRQQRVEPSQNGFEFDRMRLADFIGSLERGGTVDRYVSTPTADLPPGLRDDFTTPSYCDRSWYLRSKLWLGAAGTVTPLHRDFPHNLYAQVMGRKRFILYRPSMSRFLYPQAPWSRAPNFSRVDPEAPDLERYPRYAEARADGCVLEPGEVLYIPSQCWHHVRSLETNAAVGFWFGGPLVAALGVVSMAFKRVRRLNRGEWG